MKTGDGVKNKGYVDVIFIRYKELILNIKWPSTIFFVDWPENQLISQQQKLRKEKFLKISVEA